MKECSNCFEIKIESDFYKSGKGTLRSNCKKCSDTKEINYRRTIKGLILGIYRSQVGSSKKRGHKPPSYSKEYLLKWVQLQPNFEKLYNNWVESGYKKDLKPSVNRLKDNIPYTHDNIELVTWKENKEDQYNKSKNGEIGNELKPIIKYSTEGIQIKEFTSINEAVRETGLAQGNLWKVLNGIGKTLGGYIWKYKN